MKASLHNIGMGCKTMYLEDYKRWSEADLEDSALKEELETIKGNDEEIKDRFAVALKFGTAGLRGVLCSPPGNAGSGQLGKNTGRESTGSY